MIHLLWVGLATTFVAIDVAGTIAAARSWRNGILARWHKWFAPNNAAELVLLSPGTGAYINELIARGQVVRSTERQ